jgi:hypothetical protein
VRLGDPAKSSNAAQGRALRKMLIDVHRAEANENWNRVYTLLSKRKQHDLSVAARATGTSPPLEYRNRLHGVAVGLMADQLRLDSFTVTGKTAAVRIHVPIAAGGCYQGTTWAVFDGARGWRFDPGFDKRPNRPRTDPLGRSSNSC